MAADLYKRWTLHILYPSRYRRLVKDRVGECLLRMDEWFDRAKMNEFRKRFMSACDGRVTERIVEYVQACGPSG